MKKILFLHSGAELYGADIVMLELINGLNKKYFSPYVILPNDGPLVKKLKDAGASVCVMEYPILRRKYFNLAGIINYIYNYYRCSKKIVNYCNEKKIDIVHINTSAVLEGCYIKRRTDLPIVWHIHEILTSPKIIINFIFKKIAKYADRVICVSKAVKDNFINITGVDSHKVSVIYNGVDNKKFNANNDTRYIKKEFNINDNDIVVGMIGRVNAWKGQEDFIQAMEIVMDKKRNKNVVAILVGGVFEGQEWRMKKIEQRILDSKYKNMFILSDFRNDTPNIHNLFDIFVLPSTNPDPLPTVVLESMATGKPVVGYKHGGICEMIIDGKSGLLSRVKDVENMADNIYKLIQDDATRQKYGQISLSRQKSMFSVDNYVDSFEKTYREMGAA